MLQASHTHITLPMSRPRPRPQAPSYAAVRTDATSRHHESMAAPVTLAVVTLCTPVAAATIAAITALTA